MRVLLQRAAQASVSVDSQTIAAIGPGLLAFVGVFPADGEAQAQWLADKTLGLRIFPDGQKPMNRSVVEVGRRHFGGVPVHLGGRRAQGQKTQLHQRARRRSRPSACMSAMCRA